MSKIRDELDLKLLLRHKSIPGQVCGSCRKTVIHSENCPVVLKAELAAANQRLAEAEELLKRSRTALVAFMNGTLVDDIELMDDLNNFIFAVDTPPQAIEPEPTACTDDTPGSCVKTAHLVDATNPEYVQVRRDDLEKVLGWIRKSYETNPYYDRLKAALEGGKT